MDALKKRILTINSVFENDSTELKYDYCEDLDDGRGFTAGFFGCCTGTGDLFEVVKAYHARQPDNALSDYLETLKQLAEDEDDDTSELEGFEDAWNEASGDSEFQQAQHSVADKLYWNPAMDYCEKLGLKLPISKAVIYDTIIQHGDGEDSDSLGAIINRVDANVEEDEAEWLSEFLDQRQEVLENSHNKETRKVWRESVVRIDALRQLLEENPQLSGPVVIDTEDFEAEIE
jgi:chitosanase